MLYRKKNKIVRLSIFCTMCICITLFSATVISNSTEEFTEANNYGNSEETLEFHIQRPPDDIWYHSSKLFDKSFNIIVIPADVEHTHPALTHSHKNWWGEYDENRNPTTEFGEHTHAAFTHGPHRKTHARIDSIEHEPHNSDELHQHNSISRDKAMLRDSISHVHPEDTSHMGGRAHTHATYTHKHGDGEQFHEDHDADGEHTHPPIIVAVTYDSDYHAIPYKSYSGYNGYTHTHPESPAFTAHKAENPPHTDHTSYVAHSHDEVTHTHDNFSEHTHMRNTPIHIQMTSLNWKRTNSSMLHIRLIRVL